MMELVQEGRLMGDNPSESEDPLERLAAETPDPDAPPPETPEPETPEQEVGEEPKPPAERAEPEPDASRPKSQVRQYAVLEEEQPFEDDDTVYWRLVAVVDARNGTNARRRAFKEHIDDDEPHKLYAVPLSHWSGVNVRRSHRQVESVQIG